MCCANEKTTRKIHIADYEFEEVDSFEVTVANNGMKGTDKKIESASKAYCANKKILQNKYVEKN